VVLATLVVGEPSGVVVEANISEVVVTGVVVKTTSPGVVVATPLVFEPAVVI